MRRRTKGRPVTSDYPGTALLPYSDVGWTLVPDDAAPAAPCREGPSPNESGAPPPPPLAESPDGGLTSWQMRRIRSLIEARLNQRLPISDLASAARLSPSHFARAFKRSVGCSPHHYLLWLRIERAKDRMRTSPASLAEIALAHGFADQAHFTRCFKRLQGETPGNWFRRVSGGVSRRSARPQPR